MFRRVIKISAEDSPNVRYARAQQAVGLDPDNRLLVPGVLSWKEYQRRRETWDNIKQKIGLDGEFYEGQEVLLFPPDWLDTSERISRDLRGRHRVAQGVGVDSGAGRSSTCMAAVDELGLIDLNSKKTPNTAVVVSDAISFMKKHNVLERCDKVCFDMGGGGKEHADRLRELGYPVRTIAFGEPIALEPKSGKRTIEQRREIKAERSIFKNRRAQMYWDLHELCDPTSERYVPVRYGGTGDPTPSRKSAMCGWGIPEYMVELRRQLAPLPILYDGEGQFYLPPKSARGTRTTDLEWISFSSRGLKELTIEQLLGCSPDEADAVVLAVHAMVHKDTRARAGALT